MTLGQRIFRARSHAQLTQAQLADRTGMKQQMLAKLEAGKSTRTSKTTEIALACGVSPEWLATGKGTMVGGTGVRESPASYVVPASVRTLLDEIARRGSDGSLSPDLAESLLTLVRSTSPPASPAPKKGTR